MMQTFIEKNKKLLMFYYRAAEVGGWAFVALAGLAIALNIVALVSRSGDWSEFSRYFHHDVPWGMFSNVLPTGLLILGIAQFIWYLLEVNHKPGWILRNADKLLYLYTAILVGYYCWGIAGDVTLHYNEPYDFPIRLIFGIFYILIKLLALVGLAQIMKRSLPMIEESRTLV